MKYAVIDMGSNSIRLMIADVESGKLGKVEKFLEMTRLGAGVETTKCLCETSMQATILTVEKFKVQAGEVSALLLGAFATSAVRDAINGALFAKRVFEETGVSVEILQGDEEAELGYKGVVSGLEQTLRSERFVIVDIGGGSTELIVGDMNHILYRKSFNVGAVRMTGKHIESDPVVETEALELQADVVSILSEGIEALKEHQPTVAIGIGGTATTFGAMKLSMSVYDRDQIHNTKVSLETLSKQVNQLKQLTLAEKYQLVGLMPKRADVIYSGGVILEHVLSALKLDCFYVSDYDNLEGILVQKNII